MKMTIVAAAAVLSLGFAPAMANEGSGEPFRNNAGSVATYTVPVAAQVADTGSAAYPNFAGRPGSDLQRLAGDVLPTVGSEGAVQTANSLPTNFQVGTVAYAQAVSLRNWMLANAPQTMPVYAAVSAVRTPGS